MTDIEAAGSRNNPPRMENKYEENREYCFSNFLIMIMNLVPMERVKFLRFFQMTSKVDNLYKI